MRINVLLVNRATPSVSVSNSFPIFFSANDTTLKFSPAIIQIRNIHLYCDQKGHISQSNDMDTIQGPVVQSIVGLMSSLVVKILTVLVSTISNSQVFLLKKCE